MDEHLLVTLAAAFVLGGVGQLLAALTRMPAIVFLLMLGFLAGPFGLNVVRPATLRGGLGIVTSLTVAVILFEGGLTLRPHVLREALQPVRRLLTAGVVLTFFGALLAARLTVGLPWSYCVLFASLVIVTGPTVVTPILRRVRLQPRLHAVLKSEGILIDAVGAITAIVVLEYFVASEVDWRPTLTAFVGRLGLGAGVGLVAGLAVAGLARFHVFHDPENENLIYLAGLGLALGAFVGAEAVYSESGIMAVTVAGLTLAALPIPFRDELEKFKEALTAVGVSVLFILLAANIDWSSLTTAGWQEATLMAALIFVVRPVSVSLSTFRSGLTWRETAYISLLAPRGIVAAAMASHFARQLEQHGFELARRVESLVFLTIAATVCLQGAWAGVLARWLRVRATRPTGVLLVGVNEWSMTVARELQTRGVHVEFLDSSAANCQTAQELAFPAHCDDATDADTYELLDLSRIGTLVAMTPNDPVNTLACDAADGWLGSEHVLQVRSTPLGGTPRGRVRMAGRWAMPGTLPHRMVCDLLRRGTLHIAAETVAQPLVIVHQLSPCPPPYVSLLIIHEKSVRIAAIGETCPAGGTLIGLTRRAKAEETAPSGP